MRQKWRQFFADFNSDTQVVELENPQQVAADVYYTACGAVDRPNRKRVFDLKSEKNLCSNSWYRRVNLSIIIVSVVYT